MKAAFFLFTLAIISGAPASALTLVSPDLADGGAIGAEQMYMRCGGQNLAPSLAWTDAPKGTESFILTFVDTSVIPSRWSHWIVANIPAEATSLPKGGALPEGAQAIESNFGDAAYAGPCPPKGTGRHHYRFTLYALPTRAPAIVENSNARDLAESLGEIALAKATLNGFATAVD